MHASLRSAEIWVMIRCGPSANRAFFYKAVAENYMDRELQVRVRQSLHQDPNAIANSQPAGTSNPCNIVNLEQFGFIKRVSTSIWGVQSPRLLLQDQQFELRRKGVSNFSVVLSQIV